MAHVTLPFAVLNERSAAQYSEVNSRPTVLILGLPEQRPILSGLLAASGWEVCEGDRVLEAFLAVLEAPVAVIITCADLPDGTWRDILQAIPLQGAAPRVIVTTPTADERLWAEVLNLGGFDLAEPSDVLTLAKTAESAYRDWMLGGVAA